MSTEGLLQAGPLLHTIFNEMLHHKQAIWTVTDKRYDAKTEQELIHSQKTNKKIDSVVPTLRKILIAVFCLDRCYHIATIIPIRLLHNLN